MNPYYIVIAACLIIIVSYGFNIIARRTSIPSVLMLLALGIIISNISTYLGFELIDLKPFLEVLGIVGLILIVLEAALDLKIDRNKRKLVARSLLLALGSLLLNAFMISALFIVYLDLPFLNCLVYAIPLSITSSAIVIPSLANLPPAKKEFLTYESAFSDILGIIFFYFLIEAAHMSGAGRIAVSLLGNILFTILISVVLSLGLIFIFQKVKSEARLFLLIAILMLFYSVGKLFHLSSLIMIMVFGLILENRRLITGKFLGRYFSEDSVSVIHKDLRMITIESSFTVRTFFFVIFGMTIIITSLFDVRVIVVSIIILVFLFGSRYLIFRIFFKGDMNPEIFISPRGLITLLLFYAIPSEYLSTEFNSSILLLVIIISSMVMAWSLIRHRRHSVAEASHGNSDESGDMQALAGDDNDNIEPEVNRLDLPM